MIDTREATPERLLSSAEELFATHGFHATSIRDITDAAGANVAAVSYHFGSKEGLLRALTDRIVAPLNRRRQELLGEVMAGPQPPTVEAVLEAFLRPDVETMRALGDRRPTMARFIGRTYSEGTAWIKDMARAQFGAIGAAFGPAFAAALPHLDAAEVAWRLDQVVAVVVGLFASYPHDGLSDEQTETTVRRLITFLAPAMAAPMPPGR